MVDPDEFKECSENGEETEKLEALSIFGDITDGSLQLCDTIKKLKCSLEGGELPTEKGISLLDVKNQLLLQYLANITNIIMVKTAGKILEGNPVINRLIELRVILERIRPVEQKLKYQIDKLVKMALTGTGIVNDPSRFRANPSGMLNMDIEDGSECDSEENDENALKEKESGKERDKKTGIYVPPKLAAVHYELDEKDRKAKASERARKFALNSSVVQELKEEYLDTPTEVATTNSARQSHDRHQKRKQEYEEAYFTRLPVTKEEKKKRKRLTTLGTLGDEITHFEDISVLHGGELRSLKKRKKSKSSSKKNGKKPKGKKRRTI